MINEANINDYSGDVAAALADLGRRDVVGRIWRKDHTVWKPRPDEIFNRLGWLDVTNVMAGQVPALKSFDEEIVAAGFRHVVLLGMGGSSLGPEVLRQAFGPVPGYPELIVLDSTVPDWILWVKNKIDPARTLFLVSSKSGTTTEPLALYRYFRLLVEDSVGKEKAGLNFITVTDPGTPLEKLAGERSFRRVFINPPDIGGRYSVLSCFGLVPATLAGIDPVVLLERADRMRETCTPHTPANENPGAWLGTLLGVLARKGRNKLTLVTSPSVSGFGLWVEQLIAESTGKEGTGIVPVVAEPLLEPESYSDDRLFVYLRLEEDDNDKTDEAIARIRASGLPVVTLELKDKYDLAAEFFRWEFATAVAGHILGIQPFDQPDVVSTKDATRRILQEYTRTHRLAAIEASNSIDGLLSQAGKGKYLAIMAYIRQTEEVDSAFAGLRQKMSEKYRIATTLGYGPRFLHSTGQLHKGGPPTGLFLQITADHEEDLPVPGQPYSFGVVADAQASGDYEALSSLGRPVIRVHAGRGDSANIAAFIRNLL